MKITLKELAAQAGPVPYRKMMPTMNDAKTRLMIHCAHILPHLVLAAHAMFEAEPEDFEMASVEDIIRYEESCEEFRSALHAAEIVEI